MYSKLIIAIFILFNCELLFANEKFDNYTIRKYNEAVSYYNFGNYEKSMKIFKELYLDNPNSKIILNNYLSAANEYAMYLVNSLKYEQAIKVMEELSKIAPDKQEIIDNLGVIYLKIGNNYFKNQNYDSAIENYFKSAKYLDDKIISENIAAAYNNQAMLIKNSAEKKIELYKLSLKYEPSNFEALYNLGLVYLNEKMYNEALKYFDEILKSDWQDKNKAKLYKGIVNIELKNYDEAKKFFLDVINNSKDREEREKAQNYLNMIIPQKYNLSYNFTIKNNSAYNLNDFSLKINIPNDYSNRQKIIDCRIDCNYPFNKDFIVDADNNKFVKLQFDNVRAYQKINIKIENIIEAQPKFWNLEKLKNRKINIVENNVIGSIVSKNDNLLDALKKIYNYVLNLLEYDINTEELTIPEILEKKRGKCVEYTKLFSYLAKKLNLKVYEVSGEIYQYFDDDNLVLRLDDVGHSWAEIWLDDYGYVAFDPTFEDTGRRNYFANLRNAHIITSYGKTSFLEINYKVVYDDIFKPIIDVNIDKQKKLELLK